jgi:hypothetical protein
MPEVNFKSLQNIHESLLQKQQKVTEKTQEDFANEVKAYIDQAKKAGSIIASTRERDQVRANLRYWANYIYSIEKTFPDTELAPSTVSEKRPVGNTIAFVLFIILVLFGAIQAIRSAFGPPIVATEIPVSDETETPLPPATEPPVITPTDALPTLVFVGSDVAFTSPKNGDNVLPKTVFKGAYTNFKSESSIHVLLIRGDKLYPLQDFFAVPTESVNGEWNIGEVTGGVALYQNPDELQQPENLIVVPAACFDQSCREKLANAVQTGLSAEELPSQLSFTLYRDSSRVLYRNAYQAIQETRVVYSMSLNKTSYDIYASQLDGIDILQITNTLGISEIFPNLSPDGRKIVYVKRVKETNSNPVMYAIAIMDSNGGNDQEITEWTRNVLESPQWSADSLYIAYVVGDISQSSSGASWNIHVYDLSTQSDTPIFVESERFDQRYFTWMPDASSIIYGARPQRTGTVGIDLISMDSSGESTPFFDTDNDDIQPSIRSFENGYLLTYTVVNQDKTHDIYAVIDSDKQYPFDGTPVRLTFRRAGELVDGVKIGSANSPIPDPASNSIYYIRNVNIYRLEFTMSEGRIELIDTIDSDGERYGTLVIETGLSDDILGFDVGYMEAFFPIFIIP